MWDDNSIFSELWPFIRDLYAPLMSAPEAARKVVRFASGNGHEAAILNKRWFMVDGEVFEIKKHRNHSHFDLIQHFVTHHFMNWEQDDRSDAERKAI